jgi:hypothetical protein
MLPGPPISAPRRAAPLSLTLLHLAADHRAPVATGPACQPPPHHVGRAPPPSLVWATAPPAVLASRGPLPAAPRW